MTKLVPARKVGSSVISASYGGLRRRPSATSFSPPPGAERQVRSAGPAGRVHRAARWPIPGCRTTATLTAMSMFGTGTSPNITGQPGRNQGWAKRNAGQGPRPSCWASAAGIVTGDHRAHQAGNGVSTHGLVGPVVLELGVQHPGRPSAAASCSLISEIVAGVRSMPSPCPCPPRPPNKISVIAIVFSPRFGPGDHVAHVDLVGHRLQRVDHVQVPGVEAAASFGLADHAARPKSSSS